VSRSVPKRRSLERRLRRAAKSTLRFLRLRNSNVEVTLLSESDFKSLERKALGRVKKIPNILSFPDPPGFPHPEVKGKMLGEIYLNADLQNGDIRELTYLLIHGILHLAGYRHGKKSDMIQMERVEQKLLKRLSG